MNLSSSSEWSGSGIVAENGSPKTVAASSNETPCFFRFEEALFLSHSKLSIYRCVFRASERWSSAAREASPLQPLVRRRVSQLHCRATHSRERSPIPRKPFQLPSGSFFRTPSTVPRTCTGASPGDVSNEPVHRPHPTAQPPSRKVKSLGSGT